MTAEPAAASASGDHARDGNRRVFFHDHSMFNNNIHETRSAVSSQQGMPRKRKRGFEPVGPRAGRSPLRRRIAVDAGSVAETRVRSRNRGVTEDQRTMLEWFGPAVLPSR